MSLPPIEWFGSEAKASFILPSKNREVRAQALENTLSLRLWAGLLCRDLVGAGGGALEGQARRLCTRPMITILIWGVMGVSSTHAQGLQSWGLCAGVLHQELWSEVLGARPLHAAPHEQVTPDEAQRKGLALILLPDSIFISRELLMDFAGDRWQHHW